MTQPETTTRADADPIGELADAARLLKAACKLVEHFMEDENEDGCEAVLGVLYACADKMEAAEKMLVQAARKE